jgi:8-oxo-dGTP pyrophosphatase MutT (NUDIX family)
MTVFRWITAPLPEGIRIRQVYGFCFDDSGRVLVRKDRERFGLPGGKPEMGEDLRATLERECLEESQIVIGEHVYLGYQEVTEEGREPFAQVRLVARISEFLPRHPDPDTGRIYDRLLTPLNKVPGLLDWGVDGLLQAASAVQSARELGVDPAAVRDDIWHD